MPSSASRNSLTSRRALALQILIVLSLMLLAAETTPTATGGDEARTVRIAICQTFCIDSDIEGNLKRIEYAVEDAAKQRADIACFPETAVIGWVNPRAHEIAAPIPGILSDRIAALAKKHDIMIAIGLCEKNGEALHDSVILIGSDGEILLKHRKIYTLDELMDPPYTRGSIEDIQAVDTPIGRVGMLICADTFKDEYLDAAAAKKPELMIIPYGWAAGMDQWPGHAKQLEAVVKHAADRIGCPVIGTDLVGVISSGPWKGLTYGGQSIAVDAEGNVLGILRDRDSEVKVISVTIDRK
ncbi:MAG: carbon-nitrogen hydrolase family protein [Phycisphaerales bacterium]|nr:MAG: carbon-nitrogen hydrolase family protein [Phycisphaerales bacterium]